MIRRAFVIVMVVAACGGGSTELADIADETCRVLADASTSAAARSLIVHEATVEAIGSGHAEEEFADALRAACGAQIGEEGP